MRIPVPTLMRQNLWCALALGLVVLSAPFPRLQLVVHAFLVLALAPRLGAPLVGALWAVAAGWCLEGSLRLYPHLGGTAWADLTMVLVAGWMLGRWPLEGLQGWLKRMGTFALLLALLTHGAVRLAAGPHALGWTWLWPVLTAPLWGWLGWRLLYWRSLSGRL